MDEFAIEQTYVEITGTGLLPAVGVVWFKYYWDDGDDDGDDDTLNILN